MCCRVGSAGDFGWFSEKLGESVLGTWLRSSGTEFVAAASSRCNSASCLRISASFLGWVVLSGELGCDFGWALAGLSVVRRCRAAFATDRTRAIALWSRDGLWDSPLGGVEFLVDFFGLRFFLVRRILL